MQVPTVCLSKGRCPSDQTDAPRRASMPGSSSSTDRRARRARSCTETWAEMSLPGFSQRSPMAVAAAMRTWAGRETSASRSSTASRQRFASIWPSAHTQLADVCSHGSFTPSSSGSKARSSFITPRAAAQVVRTSSTGSNSATTTGAKAAAPAVRASPITAKARALGSSSLVNSTSISKLWVWSGCDIFTFFLEECAAGERGRAEHRRSAGRRALQSARSTQPHTRQAGMHVGGRCRVRTCDLLRVKQLRYRCANRPRTRGIIPVCRRSARKASFEHG